MADPTTQKFEDLSVSVEFDPVGASGTYTKICGIKGASVTRTANMDSDETGDCSDESLPYKVKKSVRSLEVMVSGQGTWAQESHDKMMDWWRSGATLNVKVTNAGVATGEIEVESGPAFLSQLNNTREKGKLVTAEIQIEFETLPSTTNKS